MSQARRRRCHGLDVGPRRCEDGGYSWKCGASVYYASLADPFAERGGEAVTVSRSDDDAQTWVNPTVVDATVNNGQFDDHEWIAVDKNATSTHFGRVYVTWAQFCNSCRGNGSVKILVAHSDDAGATWSKAVQVSASNNNASQGFRETGQMAVSSDGTVEDFWTENADAAHQASTQVVAVSKDGGVTFGAPNPISTVVDYPLTGTPFDVVDLFNRVPGISARVDCYPHPAADPTSTRVVVVWYDFSGGHGTVQGTSSTDGVDWTSLGTLHGPTPAPRPRAPRSTRIVPRCTTARRRRWRRIPTPRATPTSATPTPWSPRSRTKRHDAPRRSLRCRARRALRHAARRRRRSRSA